MTVIYVLFGVAIVAAVLFMAHRNYKKHLDKIDDQIKKEAKERGLKIQAYNYPAFKDWKDDPFNREIRIGNMGFDGIPTSRNYYRILDCKKMSSDSQMTYWVKVTNDHKTKTLTTEWRMRI